MSPFHVRIAGDALIFSAAHFITFAGDTCEPLHGHNYRVAAEVWGPLDENQYVVDFLALDETLKTVLGELDHAVLLPTGHPAIRVAAGEEEVEVRFQRRRWVFPRADCRLLPVANTTAELLGQYIGERLLAELVSRGVPWPHRLRIEVEESPGRQAVCEIENGIFPIEH
jgi:6-pyruvoyltetrahydropterin/6-carboxytetrahydropterin synthase